MTDLNGKTAVVTGSTKGIGLAVVEAMLDEGMNVVVSSRSEEDTEDTVAALQGRGEGKVIGFRCDVRDAEECGAMIAAAVERFGGLDVLVNNAGLGRFATIQEMSTEDWQVQIDTNLSGVFYCSKAAVPHLRESGDGWIINLGSLASRNAFGGGVGYNASKFGLLGMTEAMMLDLRYDGIRVSIVMPGSVNTHFFGQEPSDEWAWRLQPEDIGRAVMDLIRYPSRANPSRIELRPSRPPSG